MGDSEDNQGVADKSARATRATPRAGSRLGHSASVANAARDEAFIPSGPYCYASLGAMDSDGFIAIKGQCPYWESRPDEHAYCRYLDYETEFGRELLWDQVKVCGVRDGY